MLYLTTQNALLDNTKCFTWQLKMLYLTTQNALVEAQNALLDNSKCQLENDKSEAEWPNFIKRLHFFR